MKTKIYYTIPEFFVQTPGMSELTYFEPEKLTKNIPEYVKKSGYIHCSALLPSMKNIYVLKAPISLNLSINLKDSILESEDLNKAKNVLNMNDLSNESRVIQFNFGYIFFSENSIMLEQSHPFLHINNFTNLGNHVYGEYDISKWFRPLGAGFVLKDDGVVNVNIKRGEIYSYIKFKTDNDVELVRFEMSDKLHKYKTSCIRFKQHNTPAHATLRSSYEAFLYHNMKKRILKEIKRQII